MSCFSVSILLWKKALLPSLAVIMKMCSSWHAAKLHCRLVWLILKIQRYACSQIKNKISHEWPFPTVTTSVLDILRGSLFWSSSSILTEQSPRQDRLCTPLLPRHQLVHVPWGAIRLCASFRLLLKWHITLIRAARTLCKSDKLFWVGFQFQML